MDDDRQDAGSDPRPQGRRAGWVPFVVAGALVLVLGVAAFVIAGLVGGGDTTTGDALDGDASGSGVAADNQEPTPEVIAGRWTLESWQEGDRQIAVDVGSNAAGTPWLEFTQTFAGERDTFISADGTGTAGEFYGSTGCNTVNGRYEFSASFLVLDEVHTTAAGCETRTDEVFPSMLFNTPDGVEVIMGGNTMEWYGSNLEGITYPLTFRRDGAPPDPIDAGPVVTAESGDGPIVRVFDVDGVEVVTATYEADLPDRAEVVQFWTTVIDSGSGPELCLGAVAMSLPPQCSGPMVRDLAMEGWTEEAQGVRWGDRGVIVTWPPEDGEVQLLEQFPYDPPVFEYPPTGVAEACAGADLGVGVGRLNEYARSLGDANGGLFTADNGIVVLQVVGDPEPHRRLLAGEGGACVVEVPRSEAEQRQIQEAVTTRLMDILGRVGYSTSLGPGGRVDIGVPVADRATAAAIAELVNDPADITVAGFGVIVG